MATIQVQCRFCHKTEPVRKHGKGHSGFPRFRCMECRKSFQLDYVYEARKPNVKATYGDTHQYSDRIVCIMIHPTPPCYPDQKRELELGSPTRNRRNGCSD